MFISTELARPLKREVIEEYLSCLGLTSQEMEAVSQDIRTWDDLQQFVDDQPVCLPSRLDVVSATLKTYGLQKTHPLAMLVHHVFF